MSDRPKLVDSSPRYPLPDALLVDSSVLGGIGRSTPERRQLINYIQSNDKQLYVSTGVVEELDKEWAGPYGVNDWLDPISLLSLALIPSSTELYQQSPPEERIRKLESDRHNLNQQVEDKKRMLVNHAGDPYPPETWCVWPARPPKA